MATLPYSVAQEDAVEAEPQDTEDQGSDGSTETDDMSLLKQEDAKERQNRRLKWRGLPVPEEKKETPIMLRLLPIIRPEDSPTLVQRILEWWKHA